MYGVDPRKHSPEQASRIGIIPILVVLTVVGLLSRLIKIFGNDISWALAAREYLHRFVIGFERVFLEGLPFILLGALSAALLDRYFTENEVKHVYSSGLWKEIAAGIATGSLLPVGDVGGIVLGRALLRKGASLPAVAALLISAMSINLLSLGAVIGSQSTAAGFSLRAIIGIVFAIVFALLLSSERQPQILVRQDCLNESERIDQSAIATASMKAHQTTVTFVQNLIDFLPWLIAGALISGFLQAFLPQTWQIPTQGSLIERIGKAGLWGILSAQGNIGDLLSIRNMDLSGLSIYGVVYLFAGAFLDLKLAVMLLRVFKLRMVIYLVSLAAGITLVTGLLFGLWRTGI